MKILSIDIGIKNLAFCLFEIENNIYSVKKWDIVNIGEETSLLCGEIENDKSKAKSINICNKPAKYTKNNKCYCLKHSKKQVFRVPTKELEQSYLNKQKINNLFELAEKYNISYTKPIKKQDLIHLFNEHVLNKCFEPVNITNSNKVDIISIGKNIKKKFDEIFTTNNVYDNIDVILIENQISPIANRMKTIQGMIAQYFIMNNNTEHIEFVSSINKLKQQKPQQHDTDTEDKTQDISIKDYKSRKKQGITKCLEILTTDHRFNDQLSHFNTHKKKDDLSDAFLQGLWFINKQNL